VHSRSSWSSCFLAAPEDRARRIRHARADHELGGIIYDIARVLSVIRKKGVMLEAARGPVLNLVDLVAGGTRTGSWWTHPRGREIFALTRSVRDSPDVLVTRLVDGHVTYVHRRLWPAVVRLAPNLSKVRIARIREVHTTSGAHRIQTQPFPRWVPNEVRRQAASLTKEAAIHQLGAWVVPCLLRRTRRDVP
jgi:hypothetical protein